jgi:ABC-2 type transport system ATP-binding protein
MQNDIVVKARGIKKRYSDNNALNGLDLDLRQGQILGLIGPNGAGKSTFLHSVLGLLKSEGSLEVMGLEPFKNRHQLLKKICSITDVAVLPKWMTVEQMLEYVEGVHPEFDPKKARNILSKTNIKNQSKIRTLSRGMIVQLHLAIIMAIDAELLVLDEPTLGLDLVYRKEFYSRLIEDYFDGNKTILISTHQVEEIEGVLTDVVFLDKGQAVMNESIDSLNQRFLELRPNADNNEKAKSLNPINIRTELGRTVFLYENIDIEKLSSLGEVRPPFIADLFVAIMNRSDQLGEQS